LEAKLTFVAPGVEHQKLNVPSVMTYEGTSIVNQVPAIKPAVEASSVPNAGAVFQVTVFSAQVLSGTELTWMAYSPTIPVNKL
jgi:hypothetical protein